MQYAERRRRHREPTSCITRKEVICAEEDVENESMNMKRAVTEYTFNEGINFVIHFVARLTTLRSFPEGDEHGCINLPADKAAELYNRIDESVPIICFY